MSDDVEEIEDVAQIVYGKIYDSSGDKKEYAMVLRVPNGEGYYFHVSGARTYGTLAAAIYLRNHWEEFNNVEPTAGVLLELVKGDSHQHEVIERYGLPP